MRLTGKLLLGGAVGVGATTAYQATKGNDADGNKPLKTEEFNAMQDQQFLNKALGDLTKQNIAFYKLRSCPYCAVVGAVLDFGKVPYHEVYIDPLTAAGSPNIPYCLFPQLQFMYDPKKRADPLNDKEPLVKGPFLVDSEAIVKKLAVPLGYANQLEDPKVIADRSWVKENFVRTSFVAMNGTYANAFSTYPALVPQRYQNIVCRLIGAGGLCIIAKYMVRPKLTARLEQENKQRSGAENDGMKIEGEESSALSVGVLLQNAANQYVRQMVPRGSMFHGGESPDIVDLEMYGVYRSTCMQSSPARLALEKTDIGPWAQEMKKFVPTTKHPVYME